MDLSCNFEVSCVMCEWQKDVFTSKKISSSRAYHINRGSIIAFCENEKGYTGLEPLCSYPNLVPPRRLYKALG